MKKMSAEWLKAAHDDLEVIKQIAEKENLTNIASFHAEQAIEKCFKAIYEENEIAIPKIHDLIRLQKQIHSYFQVDENEKNLLMKINELYIDSRYPGDLGLLPNGKPTLEDVKEFLNFASDVYQKVKTLLEKDIEKNL